MTLVVFFSRGVSLDSWERAGILERELALYRGLLRRGDRIAAVTYGGPNDGRGVQDMPGLDVLPNRWGLPGNLYSVLAPLIHRRYLRAASVFRTNQINGSWCAVIARALFRKPLVVRCGFLWADNVERLTTNPVRRRLSRALEGLAFRSADHVVVASQGHASVVVQRYGVPSDRVTIIPNYVDLSQFTERSDATREPGRVLFVGRLEEEKNAQALIEAVRLVPRANLTIVGDGSLRYLLEQQAVAVGRDVEFLGRVEHARLPELMNRAEVLVMPSHYEGHPKVLVEAMACGLPVIGADVPGIRELIEHRRNGLLCGAAAADIAAALDGLLHDSALRRRLAANAMADVEEHCALAVVIARERTVLESLTAAAGA